MMAERKIVRWEWWRLWIGCWPRRVYDMSDPYVAGGTAELFDWTTVAGYQYWGKPEHRYEVRYWPPERVITVMRSNYFADLASAERAYRALLDQGYTPKVTA